MVENIKNMKIYIYIMEASIFFQILIFRRKLKAYLKIIFKNNFLF